jgi:DNA-binding NtrC family response regulator
VELNKPLEGIEPEALQRLKAYNWPGNVRQMEHCLKRAALLAPGPTITEHDLELPSEEETAAVTHAEAGGRELADATRRAFHQSLEAAGDGRQNLFHSLVAVVERVLVEEALALSDDNQVAAARVLGLHRTTLRKKLDQTGPGESSPDD